MFQFFVTMVLFNSKLSIIFCAFAIVYELLNSTIFSYPIFIMNTICLINHVSAVAAISYAGSSVAEEASKTNGIVAKIVNESILSGTEKINFMFFMTQLRSRNVNLESAFFKVNWNILVTVKIKMFYSNPLISFSYSC